MEQNRNRNRDDEMPNRASNMEQAEGSRESHDLPRNRQEDDLGTSSDRAMFQERESAEERDRAGRARAGTPNRREDAGGITNRPLEREQQEQERLPDRGQSQSDSER